MKNKVIAIDSSGLFFPTVFSFERQTIEKIESKSDNFIMPPHAVYFSSLLSCLKKIGVDKDTKIIVALEGRSWRKSIAGYYKAQRADDREKHKLIDWDKQFKKLNEVNDKLAKATNFQFIREWNSECDDILAVCCRYFKDDEVVIVTGDKDLYQLAFYKNVRIFNINKKCNGSKGMYEKIDNPLKVIADKVRLGDISDNIIVDKAHDTKQDEELRYEIINLLKLPDYIENSITDILKNLSKKELNLDELPNFKNAKEKFMKIYSKDKVITYDYCVNLLEKRENKKKKILKEKRDAKKLETAKEKFKDRTFESLTKTERNKLIKNNFLKILFPEEAKLLFEKQLQESKDE